MSEVSGLARIDERGRLVLPAALRKRLCMRSGDEVVLREEGDGTLRVESRLVAARTLIGSAGRSDDSAVEQLRAMRADDAGVEDADAQRDRT